ncbi:hypothetical protein C9994_02050 [Marivirga lumbricoides]|uniref:Uncharacterized protein n=1 Tax=Marivirga lumbricoides TaxID=1046115 RepID=A0A2T4DUY1_9BACT|nr:hypothetical protein C9994_02050 [Marivirga lumbricoides]
MKILIWVGIGLVVIAAIPFLLLFLGMGFMQLFAISEKKAMNELTDIIRTQYDSAWTIKKATRFFNEGNMNPNMFYMELQANQEPKVTFRIYWDAKLKEPRSSYGEKEYTLNSQYQLALEDYAMQKDIEQAIGDEAQLEYIDYWKVKIAVNDDEADFMRKTAQKVTTVIRKYANYRTAHMDVIFLTEEEPDGLYKIEIALTEPRDDLYIGLNTVAKGGELDQIKEKCMEVLTPVLASQRPTYDLRDALLEAWVNQKNVAQFYGVLEATSQKVKGDERIGMQQYEGLMFFHYNMLAHQLTEVRFVEAGKSISDDVKALNAQLPAQYRKPE